MTTVSYVGIYAEILSVCSAPATPGDAFVPEIRNRAPFINVYLGQTFNVVVD